MPNVHAHDCLTWAEGVPAALVAGYIYGWELGLIFFAACLVGGYLLSPDLDHEGRSGSGSIPYQRWGPFKRFWLPYSRTFAHRGWMTHGPVVGTIVRVLYMAWWLCPLYLVLDVAGYECRELLVFSTYHYQAELVAIAAGLEFSAFSHYSVDWMSG